MLGKRWKIAAGGSVVGLIGSVAGAAYAAGPVLHPAGSGIKHKQIVVVGSNTTQSVIGAISAAYNVSSGNTGNKDKDVLTNVLSTLPTATTVSIGAQPAGEGATCNAYTYDGTTHLPPNGSSAGISAYDTNVYPATVAGNPTTNANDQAGCVGLARSSRGRTGSDPAFIHFWAFAKDAVDTVHFKVSTIALSNLTQAQIQGIYLCSSITGKPTFTDWSQLPGGGSGAIARYLPQLGSGSLSFFDTKILGIAAPTSTVDHADDNCTNPNANGQVVAKRIEENEAVEICQPGVVPVPPPLPNPCDGSHPGYGNATADDRQGAISIFGVGDYTAEKAGLISNLTAGTKLDKINSVKPVPGTGLSIDTGAFIGWRYVYNVISDRLPGPAQGDGHTALEDAVLRFAGNTTVGPGYVCAGDAATTLVQYGMTPLPNVPDPNNPTLATSTCKLEPNPNSPTG